MWKHFNVNNIEDEERVDHEYNMDSNACKYNFFDPSNTQENKIRVIEQFASDVRSFSSQYGTEISISYTAHNIIGKPSKYPAYGDFPQTFVMRTYGKWWDEASSRRIPIKPLNNSGIKSQDYIDVVFEHKVIPLTVNIYETYHPGSVVRIWASDGGEKWSILWEGSPQVREHMAYVFSPAINKIDFYTNLLRLEFDHSQLDYYAEIDAVTLAGLREPSSNQSSNVNVDDYDDITNDCSLENEEGISGALELPSELNLTEFNNSSAIMNVEVNTSNNDGFFSVLPDESIFKIFSYLDFVSLSRCARVNRHFNALATDSLLYSSMNLKPYWYKINASAISVLSQRCQYLQKLDLSWCGSFPSSISPQIFCRFIENCGKLLTNIRLDCCQFVCACCLETISVVCKNLTEVTLKNCTGILENGFRHLAKLNTLERLDFYRTQIKTPALIEILEASPHLKHINLGGCRGLSTMDEIAQGLGTFNKELLSVDFWKTYSLTPIGVKYLSQCSMLEEIDMGWCLGVSIPGDCFVSLAKGCTRLKKLFICSLRGIHDRDLYPFIHNCPDLEQVDLLGNRCITSEVCIKILRSCKRLRFLDVSFCEQINDIEVQEWRKEFPNVDIKRSFQSEPECTCAFPNYSFPNHY